MFTDVNKRLQSKVLSMVRGIDIILMCEWHTFLRERVPFLSHVHTTKIYMPPPMIYPNTLDDAIEYLFRHVIFKEL